MTIYKYRLKNSVKEDWKIINGVTLKKNMDYTSNKKLNFGKFDYLIIEKKIINANPVVIKPTNNIERKIYKKFDLHKSRKKTLIDHIIVNTNDPLLQDKILLSSLKKDDLISIIQLMDDLEDTE